MQRTEHSCKDNRKVACAGRGTPPPGKPGDLLACFASSHQDGDTWYLAVRNPRNNFAKTIYVCGTDDHDICVGTMLNVGPGSHWTIEVLGPFKRRA